MGFNSGRPAPTNSFDWGNSILTLKQQAFYKIFTRNEESASNSLRLSNAGMINSKGDISPNNDARASGFSFGPVQFDLAVNENAREIFVDIITNSTDAKGQKIFSQIDIASIVGNNINTGAYSYRDRNMTLSAILGRKTMLRFRDKIDAALQSEYGEQAVRTATINQFNFLASGTQAFINKQAPAVQDYLNNSDLAQLLIADILNQCGNTRVLIAPISNISGEINDSSFADAVKTVNRHNRIGRVDNIVNLINSGEIQPFRSTAVPHLDTAGSTMTINPDGTISQEYDVIADSADGTLKKGDVISITSNGIDDGSYNEITIWRVNGTQESRERNADGTVTLTVWGALDPILADVSPEEGPPILTEITYNPTTFQRIGAFTFDGQSFNADGTPLGSPNLPPINENLVAGRISTVPQIPGIKAAVNTELAASSYGLGTADISGLPIAGVGYIPTGTTEQMIAALTSLGYSVKQDKDSLVAEKDDQYLDIRNGSIEIGNGSRYGYIDLASNTLIMSDSSIGATTYAALSNSAGQPVQIARIEQTSLQLNESTNIDLLADRMAEQDIPLSSTVAGDAAAELNAEARLALVNEWKLRLASVRSDIDGGIAGDITISETVTPDGETTTINSFDIDGNQLAEHLVNTNADGVTSTTDINYHYVSDNELITTTRENGAVIEREITRFGANGNDTVITQDADGNIASITNDYLAQADDTLESLAEQYGIPLTLLQDANPEITGQNISVAGESITIPVSILDGNVAAAPATTNLGVNQFYVDDTIRTGAEIAFVTGVSVAALQAANPSIDFDSDFEPGQIVNLPASANDFTFTANISGTDANIIDLNAGATSSNNLGVGVNFTDSFIDLSAALKTEISSVASEGFNTWAEEAYTSWTSDHSYTPPAAVAALANSVGLPVSTAVINSQWNDPLSEYNPVNIDAGIQQSLLEDAADQETGSDVQYWGNANIGNAGNSNPNPEGTPIAPIDPNPTPLWKEGEGTYDVTTQVWVVSSRTDTFWVDTSYYADVEVPDGYWYTDWVDTGLEWESNWVYHEELGYSVDEGDNVPTGYYDDFWQDTSYTENRYFPDGYEDTVEVDTSHNETVTTTMHVQVPYDDPVVLDLDGNGIKLSAYSSSTLRFNVDNDITASQEITGWVSSGDGLLAMDQNDNGKIDGANELVSEFFLANAGTRTFTGGLAALAALDGSTLNGAKDGKLNANDNYWNQLKVWVDANSNGITDDGELKSLSELGITELNLTSHTPTTAEAAGIQDNTLNAVGSFTRNGSSYAWGDVQLKSNPNGVVITTSGSGSIISTDAGTKSYITSTTLDESLNTATLGAGVNNLYAGSGNDTLAGDTGVNWLAGGTGSDAYNAGAGDDVLLVDAEDLPENIHAGMGTDLIKVVGSEGVTLNLARLEAEIAEGGAGADILVAGGRATVVMSGGGGDDILVGGAANDILSGDTGIDIIDGGSGDDLIRGGADSDSLLGGIGNDVMDGGAGNDTIVGGVGNDTLAGGSGNDTFEFSIGDGADSITDASGTDRLVFGADILPSNVTVTRTGLNGNQVTLTTSATNSVTIDETSPGQYAVETISFADGTEWQTSSFRQMLNSAPTGYVYLYAEAGSYIVRSFSRIHSVDLNFEELDDNDGLGSLNFQWQSSADNGVNWSNISGATSSYLHRGCADVNSRIRAIVSYTDGHGTNESVTTEASEIVGDYLLSSAGNNTVTGTVGTDYLVGRVGGLLYGLAGNDQMIGEYGPVTMYGGFGNDIYEVTTPQNIIYEYIDEGVDTVHSHSSYTLSDNIENMTLVENVIYAVNATGNNLANILIGNFMNNTITGAAGNDSIDGKAGNDIVYGGADNDTIDGGLGNDYMAGGTGNDTYYRDSINDTIVENANEGSDTLNSAITYSLANTNIENLTLTGSANINATGNEQNNILNGNSGNNVLDGGAGADSMTGGAGNDTYFVDVTGDKVDDSEGNDTINSSFTYDLTGINIENLTLAETALIATQVSVDDYGWWSDGEYSYWVIIGSHLETQMLPVTPVIDGNGNAVANVLIGNSAKNVLTGGAGNDTLDGKGGADTMYGGIGDDIYLVDSFEDVVTESASTNEGNDTVQSTITYSLKTNVENLTLSGSAAINGTGNDGNNILTGNAAANILDGKAGEDTMTGGNGNDTYYVDNAGDVVVEIDNQGIDTVISSINYALTNYVENLTLSGTSNINATANDLANTITGNSGNNIINAGANNDIIYGGAGNDTIDGGLGNDYMAGGTGNDTYYLDSIYDAVVENANDGNDTLNSAITYNLTSTNLENLTLTGSANINATGNEQNNILIGNSNNNVLDGGVGADNMTGGAGNDTYFVDSTGDGVDDSAGIDTVNSSITYDLTGKNIEYLTLAETALIATQVTVDDYGWIYDGEGSYWGIIGSHTETQMLPGTPVINGTGNTESNVITGNSANNVLTGGAGNDTLDGKAGVDILIGGSGNDYYYADSTDVVTENADEGTDIVWSSYSNTLGANIETLYLIGSSAINGTGNSLDNYIFGNDNVNSLFGSSGNDTLAGGGGADTLIGGTGNDFYLVDNIDVLTENAYEGTDTVRSFYSYTLGANVENLTLYGFGGAINGTGNTLDNVITGNSANNVLTGNAGNDTLDGGGGNDSLTGGSGNDTYILSRGNGNDSIFENDSTVGNTDIAQFSAGIATNQLWFQKVGNNLEVSIIGTNDKFNIQNWYSGSQCHVEQFKTSDGNKLLLDTQVEALVTAMAAFTPPAPGQTTLPQNYQDALAPVLAANWH